MSNKDWDGLTVEEKIDDLGKQLVEFIAHSNKQLLERNHRSNEIISRLETIETRLTQIETDIQALRPKN